MSHAMMRHEFHHPIDALLRGYRDHAVSHDLLHRHRRGGLAVTRECVNDFTFGNETKNCLPASHHKSADVLYAQPVRCPPNAGFRSIVATPVPFCLRMVSIVIAASPELPHTSLAQCSIGGKQHYELTPIEWF